MQEREQVDLLLGEFGREIGLAGLALDEDGHAALAFDDVLVNFEVEEGDERLLLYAYLGEIRGDAAASMRAMLEANLFWRGADGGTGEVHHGDEPVGEDGADAKDGVGPAGR